MLHSYLVLLGVACLLIVDSVTSDSAATILSELTGGDYIQSDPPLDNEATRVQVGFYVNSFGSFDENKMEYTLNGYFRQQWTDGRLQFRANRISGESILLPDGSWDKVWTPGTFFRNERHTETTNQLLKLWPDGKLWYVQKLTLTLSCPMNFHRFPIDTQSCPMMIETFGYTMDVVILDWLDTPVDLDASLQLSQYKLQDTLLFDCSQNYTSGSFPCLAMKFILERQRGYYLQQVYLPSVFIVMLSWLSFWLNIEQVASRTIIGLLCFLGMVIKAMKDSNLRETSYPKAIDIWLFSCVVFTVLALLQLPLAHMMRSSNAMIDEYGEEDKYAEKKSRGRTTKLDLVSRIMFPSLFVLLCGLYWAMYFM